MEHKTETNHVVERKKRKKKTTCNNQRNQVTPKLGDDQKKKLNMNKSSLKIDPSTSSNTNMVLSRSNYTSTLTNDDINQSSENFKIHSNLMPNNFIESNLSSAKLLKDNNSSKTDGITFNIDVSSDKNVNTWETSSSYIEIDNLKHKSMAQFMKCEGTDFVRCSYCHCIFSDDVQELMEHAIKCQNFNELRLNIKFFCCYVCDKILKSLKSWKSHAISTSHLDKCMCKNNYVSYICGGCKTLYFGPKNQILSHCKDVHKDSSKLPCIFKCMEEVFHQFIFVGPGNWKSWTFCGPCKKYSAIKINCYSSNHNNRKTKHFKCNSCLIDFICSLEVYNKHLISCEHIMLEYLRTNNYSNPKLESLYNLKLPPIFLNRFTIDNEKATCNDCKIQMISNENIITVHLTECIYKADMGGKITTKIQKFFCAVCNETISDFSQWKIHIILSSHLIKCYGILDLVSYTCEICSLHCYGKAHHVTEHQNIHPNNSDKYLSEFLAFNFQRINKDSNSKEFYYCEDCETYAEVNFNSDHWNKSHKTKLKRRICRPCHTEFFFIEGHDLFNKHILSSEHMILKYVATNKLPLKLKALPLAKSKILNNSNKNTCDTKSTLEIIKNQVPFIIEPYLKWFKNIKDKDKVACIACGNIIDINENVLLNHLLVCNQNTITIIPKINFKCLECKLYSNNYKSWEQHAIAHIKLNTYGLYSYFCKSCNSLLYGKINDIELHLSEHKIITSDMPLETVLVAKQLMRRNNNNSCKSPDIMCFCEPCKKIFKKFENHNHFNTDSHALIASDLAELFYCKYCLVEFYCSSTAYECHKLTVEHIILSSKYCCLDINTIPKLLKLDAHLFKFVIDQTLYDKTLNIGFFCFVCDYLCVSLDTWKFHLNSKKHINSSKGLCMDHRCKICKTLMFGQRQHMFEHYSNRFHSLLRKFKLITSTDLKQNNLLLQTKCRLNMQKTTSEVNKISITHNHLSEESINNTNEIHSIVKCMDESILELNTYQSSSLLEESTTNINETCSTVKMIDEFPLDVGIQEDCGILEESTSNINETHSMVKMINELPLKLSTCQNNNIQEESSFNGILSMTKLTDEYPLKLNTQKESSILKKCTTNVIETLSVEKETEEVSLESNTKNYRKFYELRMNMLNDLLNTNKEIKLQYFYYCVPCDFITAVNQCWDNHNLISHSNEIEVRHKMFCNICNLYQVGPLNNLDDHITTIEHKNMVDFKKLYNSNNMKKLNNITKQNENNNNSPSDESSNVTKTTKKERNDGKRNEKETNNRRILIEIKGAKPQYKKNNYVELKKILSTYGYFGIHPKQDSAIIIFRKLSSTTRLLKDKENLETTHEFNISIVVEEDELPKLHRITQFEFGNKEILLKAINTQLIAINQEICKPDMYHRLALLINSIHCYSGQYFLNSKTHVFGSRMSGLALRDSDVDLYFDIANTFNGSLSNDLHVQEDLVRYFGKIFRSQNNEFKYVQQITGARVPIVKFFHGPSGLNCDLSFKSGLSTHNTKLVRLYLTLDKRVHWVVCAVVKRWALQNDLKSQSMFTSYALAWLVLFYLMTRKVVPPLKFLRDHAVYSNNRTRNEISDEMFIEDWDCTFCTQEKAKQIWKVPEFSCWDILLGFFEFYSDPSRLEQFVLCPSIGEAILKEKFFHMPMESPDILGFYKKKTGNITEWRVKLRTNFFGKGLAVQDPFDLFHNITKPIIPRKLQGFSHLCKKTKEIMDNGIQPYYA